MLHDLTQHATSLRTLQGERLHLRTGNSECSQRRRQDRLRNSDRSRVSNLMNLQSPTLRSRNLSQNASSNAHVVKYGQQTKIPRTKSTPTNMTSPQNVTYCRTLLISSHVSSQCQGITEIARGELTESRHRSFSCLASSPNCGQRYRCGYRQ